MERDGEVEGSGVVEEIMDSLIVEDLTDPETERQRRELKEAFSFLPSLPSTNLKVGQKYTDLNEDLFKIVSVDEAAKEVGIVYIGGSRHDMYYDAEFSWIKERCKLEPKEQSLIIMDDPVRDDLTDEQKEEHKKKTMEWFKDLPSLQKDKE